MTDYSGKLFLSIPVLLFQFNIYIAIEYSIHRFLIIIRKPSLSDISAWCSTLIVLYQFIILFPTHQLLFGCLIKVLEPFSILS